MAHIWQGARSREWLTLARARGYSLIMLVICTIAFAGQIALSDGLIDRNEKPIGQRLLQRLCGRRADLTGEACGAAGIWHAFADSTSFTQAVVPEQSGTALENIQSAFSAARNWGADVKTAYAIQIALGLSLAVGLATARPRRLRAEGVGARHREPARDGLGARLRSRLLGDLDRTPGVPRLQMRLTRLRDQRARRRLDRAAHFTRPCRRHRNPPRSDLDSRALRRDAAAGHHRPQNWPIAKPLLRPHRASRKRDRNFRRALKSCSAPLQCGRGFRLFLFASPCGAGASASFFGRVAAR